MPLILRSPPRTLIRLLAVAVILRCGDRPTRAEEQFPPSLVQFTPYGHNPVFTADGPEHWDTKIRERGWILKEGDTWRMWYTGYDGTREGQKKLGLATSPDGLKWTRDPRNPIYQEHWVEDVQVIKHDKLYYIFAEGRDDQAQLLTSTDGVVWKRIGPLDVRLKNGKLITSGPYGTPVAYFENGVWNLFYERRDAGIWLARSTDMKVWTNVDDQPVLSPGPDLYDRDYVAMNQVVKHAGRYYAYYHGAATPEPQLDQEGKRRPALWSTAIAVSDDLVHWKKYAKNPLFPISANKSSGILIQLANENRLYTMHDQVNVHIHRKEPAR
ncbi:MAG: glycosylase [Planctomycetota bacterium]|nr:glycosylase [Planctomycetota bacterium]